MTIVRDTIIGIGLTCYAAAVIAYVMVTRRETAKLERDLYITAKLLAK